MKRNGGRLSEQACDDLLRAISVYLYAHPGTNPCVVIFGTQLERVANNDLLILKFA
ncbi:hypothetical protein RR42_s1854 [Cupriavidus basilensis]|uniref:Uncharacterized protein n=1 Tax=Cupriavidus basilensis TaxID=68895 RepID=A0A0C4YCT3_9BURK|nr:hypothetical protein RR42_s1854 [Cupriavidus basilensis]